VGVKWQSKPTLNQPTGAQSHYEDFKRFTRPESNRVCRNLVARPNFGNGRLKIDPASATRLH
jgi:hypothetical protein